MRTLIVGCGYTGMATAKLLLSRGHQVTGLRRNWAGAEPIPGLLHLSGDILDPKSLANIPRDFDWVINLLSSSGGGLDAYRGIYIEGMANLLTHFANSPLKKFVYTSSTSVYGQMDGSAVNESSLTTETSDTGRILVESEHLLLNAFRTSKFPGVILRAAGLYGPGRGHLFLQYLKNEARLTNKGESFVNMIHVDDLAGVILAALSSGRAGEIYNAVDDEPVKQIHFFRWLSETLGKWMPPAATAEEESAPRKRARTNKRVQNRRLKMELGYRFIYPTYRQGYTAEIKRMDDAGELDIQPEPR